MWELRPSKDVSTTQEPAISTQNTLNMRTTRTLGRSYGLGDGGERGRFVFAVRALRKLGERISTSIFMTTEDIR